MNSVSGWPTRTSSTPPEVSHDSLRGTHQLTRRINSLSEGSRQILQIRPVVIGGPQRCTRGAEEPPSKLLELGASPAKGLRTGEPRRVQHRSPFSPRVLPLSRNRKSRVEKLEETCRVLSCALRLSPRPALGGLLNGRVASIKSFCRSTRDRNAPRSC